MVTAASLALALLSCSLLIGGDEILDPAESEKDPLPTQTPAPAAEMVEGAESSHTAGLSTPFEIDCLEADSCSCQMQLP